MIYRLRYSFIYCLKEYNHMTYKIFFTEGFGYFYKKLCDLSIKILFYGTFRIYSFL